MRTLGIYQGNLDRLSGECFCYHNYDHLQQEVARTILALALSQQEGWAGTGSQTGLGPRRQSVQVGGGIKTAKGQNSRQKIE